MSHIIGIDDMTPEDVLREVRAGARFVIYHYCISIIILTFKLSSPIYFEPVHGRTSSWRYTIISFLFGWWGIPWGPIRTVQALNTNFGGGVDVTNQVTQVIRDHNAIAAVHGPDEPQRPLAYDRW